jgi:hypothetical protein
MTASDDPISWERFEQAVRAPERDVPKCALCGRPLDRIGEGSWVFSSTGIEICMRCLKALDSEGRN